MTEHVVVGFSTTEAVGMVAGEVEPDSVDTTAYEPSSTSTGSFTDTRIVLLPNVCDRTLSD